MKTTVPSGRPRRPVSRRGASRSRTLGLKAANPDGGFFDLGGKSLLILRLHKLIRSRLGVWTFHWRLFSGSALAAYLNQPTPREKQ